MANKIPFRYGTRQDFQYVGSITYAAAQAGTPLELPRVGFLSRIMLVFNGTITLSGAGALSNLGPWNLFSRVKVNTNINSYIWDTTGYGAFLENKTYDKCFSPDLAGIGSTTPDTNIYSVPVASGANTWVFPLILDIGANTGSNFEAGLINLQSPQVRVTVELTFGALTDPAALATAITGSVDVYYEYYELPDPSAVQYPNLMLCRTIEDQQPVSGTGPNIYTVPRQGTLLHQIQYLRLNNARSNSYDSAQVRFNFSTLPYQINKVPLRLRNRQWTGQDWPTGTYLLDFWHSV